MLEYYLSLFHYRNLSNRCSVLEVLSVLFQNCSVVYNLRDTEIIEERVSLVACNWKLGTWYCAIDDNVVRSQSIWKASSFAFLVPQFYPF